MQIAEITRAETSERARLLSVDSYAVTLDLTRGSEVFGSTSVIRFGCAEPGAASYADLIAESVREITLNFDVLPEMWSASGGHLRVARGAALFPVTAASQELIDQIDAFLGLGEREPGLVRVLIERRDQVRLALRSRALAATAS